MSEPEPVQVVLVTAPEAQTGAHIARRLVEERLAACVSLVPGVRSIYRWEGRVEDAAEVMLVIKSSAARFDAVAARVKDLHPYDLPEVIALPIVAGIASYLAWIAREVGAEPEGAGAGEAGGPRGSRSLVDER